MAAWRVSSHFFIQINERIDSQRSQASHKGGTMARNTERVREEVKGLVDPEYFQHRTEDGWRLVAVEWERETRAESAGTMLLVEEVPFGLQVAEDCLHLKENPDEMRVLLMMMELIVQDNPLSRIADELNRQGFRTRHGGKWSPVSVFNMLPRLIEAGPRMFTTEEWVARRKHFERLWEPTAV